MAFVLMVFSSTVLLLKVEVEVEYVYTCSVGVTAVGQCGLIVQYLVTH